jgi:hypothetical protein
MDKKHKKVTVILILLLITMFTFNPASSKNTNLSDDQIDQEQTQANGKDYIYSNHLKAQSFKPTTKTLTKIQLNINRIGDITSDFEISIKNSISSQSLTSLSVPYTEIPPTNPEWIEFNFIDINVTVDQTYYIICKTSTGDEYNSYNWYESSDNPYERGIKYYSDDNGENWQQSPENDFCFKTYGQKVEIDIPYIKGGFGWNINYGIENIGTTETSDIIDVYIAFSGGLILTGNTRTDNINQTIPPGEIIDKTLSPVIGFGPTEITITIYSPELPATSKTAQAFLFLFSIYITPL